MLGSFLFQIFRLNLFINLGIGILIIAFVYGLAAKYYPQAPLPYKEQIYGLQEIIINKIDYFIDKDGDVFSGLTNGSDKKEEPNKK